MKKQEIVVKCLTLFTITAALVGCLDFSEKSNMGKLASQRNEEAPPRVLRDIDGGALYFEQFRNALPSTPEFFPVGVWLESIGSADEVDMDREAGINVYVDITEDSDLRFLKGSGSFLLSSSPSDADNGAVLADEPDMWAGPGDAAWTGYWPGQGPACEPHNSKCGYTLQRQLAAGVDSSKILYANYGKGVTFWQSDDEASVFVNEFQDIVSADNYWFTDPNICGQGEGGAIIEEERPLTEQECRLAANYGWTVERLRSLVSPAGSKPVWAFVELGQPFGEPVGAASPQEIRAAVWSSIIHGARGVVYFNHSFGGSCRSFHVLREPCAKDIRDAVTNLNRQIAELAPVLNAPFLDGAVTHTNAVEAAVKVHEGDLFIFSGSARNSGQEVQFELPCLALGGGSVTVLGENRVIDIQKGLFRDSFEDGNSVHLYRIEGAASLCMP